MGFKDDIDSEIVSAVTDEFKKAESWLRFQAVEIKSVFSLEELKDVESFVREMKKAANDNERTKILINNINQYGQITVKLLKLTKILI